MLHFSKDRIKKEKIQAYFMKISHGKNEMLLILIRNNEEKLKENKNNEAKLKDNKNNENKPKENLTNEKDKITEFYL
ncbi:MAG: hypothetical protein ACFFCS_03895 [Candidatus Hodarchaeota archaeon]